MTLSNLAQTGPTRTLPRPDRLNSSEAVFYEISIKYIYINKNRTTQFIRIKFTKG